MKNRVYIYIALAIFFIVVIYTIIPSFGKQYIPTHDGEYHIIRIVEFSRMLRAGYWFPRWAPSLNSGYGIPIFQFHYPLPNYAGFIVRFFTHDAVYAFQNALGIAYIVLALSCIFWLRTLFPIVPSIFGSIIGIITPYLFVDMYVRGSIGEVWCIAFLYVTLYLLERKKYVHGAIFYACIILSHNILAMLFTPFIFLYEFVRGRRSWWFMLGGVGMSAYFWLPALVEQRFVVGLNTVNFRDHFVEWYELLIPSWGTEFSATSSFGNKMSFQIGIMPVVSMLGAVFTLKRKFSPLVRFLLLWMCACIFLMLPVSKIIWNILTPLQLIQYPWRLLSFVSVIASASSAYWISNSKKFWIGPTLALFAIIFSISYVRPVRYEPRNELYYLTRQNFTNGTSSMGNSFSTIWTSWKTEKPKSNISIFNGKILMQSKADFLHKEYEIEMSSDGEVIFNTLYFPGWSAAIDNTYTPVEYKKDGIIHVSVIRGKHMVSLKYQETLIRMIADSISIASFLIVMIWGILPSIL